MRAACTNEADEGVQCSGQAAGTRAALLPARGTSGFLGRRGNSVVLRVGPHLEIPTRVPCSASRAAGEPPAPGAKVFTENVRHLGSFIEKRPVIKSIALKCQTCIIGAVGHYQAAETGLLLHLSTVWSLAAIQIQCVHAH